MERVGRLERRRVQLVLMEFRILELEDAQPDKVGSGWEIGNIR